MVDFGCDFGFVTLSQALFASTRFQKVKGEWNPMDLCFFTSCQAERFLNMKVCLQLHTNMKVNHVYRSEKYVNIYANVVYICMSYTKY